MGTFFGSLSANPDILNYSRVELNNEYEMTFGDKRVFFLHTYFVNTSFLRMFDFPQLEGDRKTALQKPNSIVLTESAARKLFSMAEPLDKNISHFGSDTLVYTVTEILKDVPADSQFQFDALQSFNTPFKPDWRIGRVTIMPDTSIWNSRPIPI